MPTVLEPKSMTDIQINYNPNRFKRLGTLNIVSIQSRQFSGLQPNQQKDFESPTLSLMFENSDMLDILKPLVRARATEEHKKFVIEEFYSEHPFSVFAKIELVNFEDDFGRSEINKFEFIQKIH